MLCTIVVSAQRYVYVHSNGPTETLALNVRAKWLGAPEDGAMSTNDFWLQLHRLAGCLVAEGPHRRERLAKIIVPWQCNQQLPCCDASLGQWLFHARCARQATENSDAGCCCVQTDTTAPIRSNDNANLRVRDAQPTATAHVVPPVLFAIAGIRSRLIEDRNCLFGPPLLALHCSWLTESLEDPCRASFNINQFQ